MHSFTGGATDRASPQAGLCNVNGVIYGTTQAGGTGGNGTIFTFDTTTNTERPVYSFSGPNDGAIPQSGLILVNGKYYGTTSAGGDGALYSFKIVATAPTANNDNYQGSYKMPIKIPAPGVLGNDTNGSTGPFKAVLVTGSANGTLTLKANGSFTYVPTGTFAGTDSFTYQDTNSVGTSNVATVTLVRRICKGTCLLGKRVGTVMASRRIGGSRVPMPALSSRDCIPFFYHEGILERVRHF